MQFLESVERNEVGEGGRGLIDNGKASKLDANHQGK